MYNHTSIDKVQVKMPTYGVYQLPGHFPGEMNKMFHGFEFMCSYIDDLLIIT